MKPWKITFDGRSWTNTDAKAMHLAAVAELVGDTWAAVDPWGGPRALMAWIAVLLSPVQGLAAAIDLVNSQPIDVIVGSLSDPD